MQIAVRFGDRSRSQFTETTIYAGWEFSWCCHLRFNFSNTSRDTQLRVPLNTCASSTTFKFVYHLMQIASQRFLLFEHFQIISTMEFQLDLLEEEEAACTV